MTAVDVGYPSWHHPVTGELHGCRIDYDRDVTSYRVSCVCGWVDHSHQSAESAAVRLSSHMTTTAGHWPAHFVTVIRDDLDRALPYIIVCGHCGYSLRAGSEPAALEIRSTHAWIGARSILENESAVTR